MISFEKMRVCFLALAMTGTLTAIGCGDSKDGPDADGGTGGDNSPGDAGDDADSGIDKMLAICDSAAGDNHTCTEYLSPRPNDIDRFKAQCDEVFMGSLVASCPKGRVGGCMLDQGGGTLSTTWYYAADTNASNCRGSATYVMP